MTLTAFDYAVLGIFAISVLLGVWRGMVGELLALGAWIAAFFAARAYADQVAPWFDGLVAQPVLRTVLAWVVMVVAVLVVVAIARKLVSLLLKATGLSVLDRMLGACFGLLRGAVVVLLAVMLAGMTPLPAAAWWREATLAPPLETAVLASRPWLPPDVAKRIKYR